MKFYLFFILTLFLVNTNYSQSCKQQNHQHKPLNEKQALAEFKYNDFITEFSRFVLDKGYTFKTDECLRNFYLTKNSNLVSAIFTEFIEGNNKPEVYKALFLNQQIEFKNYLNLFIEHETAMRLGYEKIKLSELSANNYKTNLPPPSPLAACTNQDFELGNLSGWTTTAQAGSGINTAFASTPGPDANVPSINRVFAGGFSACINVLGSGTDLDWREISQTFLVTNANKDFVFYVAVIIDGGSHACATNPFFNVAVTNSVGAVIPCSSVSLIGSGTFGTQCSTFNGWNTSGVFDFLPWSPVIVPLAAYVGQNVTIKYRVTRCNGGGGHGARAYLESSCNPAALQATGNLICPGKSVTINAPNISGYNYNWTGPAGNVGSTYSISPTQAGVYTVTMALASNAACKMVLDTAIVSIPAPTPSFNYTVTPCAPTFTVPFESTSTSFSTDPIATHSWVWGDATTNGSGVTPLHTYATTGVKNITLNIQSTAGCTATTSQSLQINAPIVAGFTKKNTCEDAILNFTNTSVPIANILTQTWNFGDGSSIDTQYNTSHTYTAPGVYTVTLTVTSVDFCNSQSIQTLTVYPKPVIVASSNTVCLNLTTVFTNSSTVTAPFAITNWAWDFDNNGTTDNNAYAPTNAFGVGIQDVELKGTTNVGCKDSLLFQVTVNAGQTANFTTGNACINSAITINNSTTVAPPDFIVSYDWFYGSNATPATSTGYNPIVPIYSTSGVKTITLNITSNTTCTASLIQTVDVYPRPQANFSVSAVCQATATEFTDLSFATAAPIVHWQWDFENNGIMDAIGFNATPNYVYPTSGTYTAAVVVTDANGCRDTTTNSLDVWGHSLPNFNALPTCFNSITNFTNSTVNNVNTNAGFILTYDWNFGDGDSLNAIINPPHTYTTGVNGTTFNVTLYSTTNHLCIDKIVKTVTINPIPQPFFVMTNACLNSSVGITNTSIIAPSATITNVQWAFGANATPATSNITNPLSLTYNLSGVKITTLTLTSNQSCTATITDTLEIYEQPKANFTSTAVCQGTGSPFNDISITSGGVIDWKWDFDNNGVVDVIGTTNAEAFTFTASGTFNTSLIITDNNTCKDTIVLPVTVYGHSLPNFIADSVCFNTITTFTNTTNLTSNLNVDGALSYSWNLGDGLALNPFINPVYTFTNSTNGATYDVTLTVTTNHNCVDSITKTIIINPLPTSTFVTTNACLNTPIGLLNNSTVAPPATVPTNNWLFDADATSLTSAVKTPTNIAYSTTGIKNITLNLTSSQSCTATVTSTVQIYAQPTANFSVTSVCQNTNSVFTDLSTPTGSIALAQWYFDNNTTIDATGSIVTNIFLTSGSLTSTLVATDINGCKDTTQASFDVWGHSTPNFIADTVCFNTATTFTNQTSITGTNVGSVQTYSYNFGDGSALNSLTSPAHTYTLGQNGISYSVTLIATTNHNCVDSITKTIIINPIPTLSFTPSNACLNSTVGLLNNSTVASPAMVSNQSWSFGIGASIATSTLNNPVGLTYNTSGVKTIILSVTSNQNCTTIATKTVVVYAQPIANFSVTEVCEGLPTVFTDLSTSNGSISFLQWDYTNDTFIDANGNSPSTIFPSSGIYTGVLIAKDNVGCKDTVTLTYNVWGHTIPNFTPNAVCYGTATSFVNLTNITTNANVDLVQSYVWNFGDNTPTVSVLNPNHTFLLGANTNTVYQVMLKATSVHGCADSLTKPVSVYATPTASFNANDVCYGATTNFFDASNGNGNSVNTFKWDIGNDGIVDVNGIQNPNVTVPNFGTIAVGFTVSTTPTASLVCENAIVKNIMVNPLPKPNFIFANKCINSQPNTFNANTTTLTLGSASNYDWNFGDGQTTSYTLSTATHSYAAAGNYNVALTVYSDKGCFKDTTKQISVYEKASLADITFNQTCAGDTMHLTPIYLPNGANVTNYVWDFDPTLNIKDGWHVFNNGGTYTVNLSSTTNNGCLTNYTKVVEVNFNPFPNFSAPQSGCGPEFCTTFKNLSSMPLMPAGTNEQIDKWEWSFGDGAVIVSTLDSNQTHCYTNSNSNQTTQFTPVLITTTNKGCFKSSVKPNYISVLAAPIANFIANPNPGDLLTPLIYFSNQSQNYNTFAWNFGDGPTMNTTDVNPAHIYGDFNSTTYTVELTVANALGCKDVIYKTVEIAKEFVFYMPNAFSPDEADGINDTFSGKGIGIDKFELLIFDRWGEMIFKTTDINKGWDGRKKGRGIEKQDVYTWKVYLTDVFGKKHDYVGHVTII